MDETLNQSTTHHLKHKDIEQIYAEQESLPDIFKNHINECERCSGMVELLHYARQTAGDTKPDQPQRHFTRLQLSEVAVTYYEQDLHPKTAANLIQHLKTCSQCFGRLGMMFEESWSAVPTPVLQEAKSRQPFSLAETVLKQKPAEKKNKHRAHRWLKIPDFLRLKPVGIPQWGLAFALFIIMVGGIFSGFRYYQTTYRINLAEQLLLDNHRIYIADTPRLSGDYKSTGIGELMSAESPTTYLDKALTLTEQAIESGSKSTRARRLEAQIFMIENQYAKADSIFNKMPEEARNSSAVLNDRGVWEFEQENWQEAENYFESAIRADPELKEAYYNLALAQAKSENKEQAMATLQQYLELETDEGWRNAAFNLLNKLKRQE